MKKKGLLIGAVIWAVIAVVIAGIFIASVTGAIDISKFFRERTEMMNFSHSVVKEETVSADELNSINIDCAHYDMKIYFTSGNEISVKQYDVDDANLFELEIRDGELRVKVESKIRLVMFYYEPRLEIYLPDDYAGNVSLTTTSGNINCTEFVSWDNTQLKTSSGTIRLENGIRCSDLTAQSSSGTIRMGGIFSDSANIKATSGTVTLGDIEAQGALNVSTSSGSIRTGNIKAGFVAILASSGTIKLGEISADGDISLSTTSGTIATEGAACKSFKSASSSGTLRHGDITASGSVNISTSSGSHSVGYVTAGEFDISSSSGTLKYAGISGHGFISSTSGSISCDTISFTQDTRIESSSGTVRLGFAENQNVELEIKTSSGSINTGDIFLYYDKSGHNAYGTVGTGAVGKVTVKTTSGSIRIQAP